jgi:hypothetical protein
MKPWRAESRELTKRRPAERYIKMKNSFDEDFFCENDDPQGQCYGALSTQDDRAQGRTFHSIGYVDAFEASKDTNLQQGFEHGYSFTFEKSKRMGGLLGSWAASNWLQRFPSNISHSSPNTENKDVLKIVREFIIQRHQVEASDYKAFDAFETEIQRVECALKLKEKLKE